MSIKSLEGVPYDKIFQAFSRAFDPSLSFAFFDNQNIVAFILNGVGNFRDIATAYDTGTGTLKEPIR